jgi:hypothetical protein
MLSQIMHNPIHGGSIIARGLRCSDEGTAPTHRTIKKEELRREINICMVIHKIVRN